MPPRVPAGRLSTGPRVPRPREGRGEPRVEQPDDLGAERELRRSRGVPAPTHEVRHELLSEVPDIALGFGFLLEVKHQASHLQMIYFGRGAAGRFKTQIKKRLIGFVLWPLRLRQSARLVALGWLNMLLSLY